MIIDIHGHYTTAPKQFEDWRRRQIEALGDASKPPLLVDYTITDDEIRESIEKNQLPIQRTRGIDLTIFSPRAGGMAHHYGNATTSEHWTVACNDMIHRVCTLYPDNYVGVCQLPQSPGVSPKNCVRELERCVKELGFIGDWAADNAFAQRLGLDQPTWEDWFASANYSRIDSEIELDPASSGINTNLQRPLEGQSPYAVNFSAGYRHPEGKREATLLYNVSGKRIAQVGVDTQPDVYEQPAGQLDFSWREDLGRGWALKLRLRNLLDPRIEYRQGEDAVTREYRKGRAAMLTLEWSPQE